MNPEQWQDQVVDGRYQLRRYLGGSGSSAVFLTGPGGSNPQQAAIKLIPSDAVDARLVLARWEEASRLSHPHLIRLFEAGRCRLADVDLLYAVMEYAEENLAEVLAERPLAPAEARQMLEPAVEALSYLHGMGLVHGGLKPGNVLATGDQLKLSSDSIRRAGDCDPRPARSTPYDPPELSERGATAAGDVWSLAATLVAALTQRAPLWERDAQALPAVPDTLPQPFLDLARRALERDPARRASLDQIRACMRGEPLKVSGRRPRARRFAWLGIAAVLLAAAVLVAPGLLNRPPEVEAPAAVPAAGPATPQTGRPSPSGAPVAAPEAREQILPPAMQAQPAPPHAPPEAVERVLPEVPQYARDTIQGTVRVGVRVTVDASGKVVDAALESPGPSRYFASLALEAARRWRFDPAPSPGQPASSDWILRFEIRRDATAVSVQPPGR